MHEASSSRRICNRPSFPVPRRNIMKFVASPSSLRHSHVTPTAPLLSQRLVSALPPLTNPPLIFHCTKNPGWPHAITTFPPLLTAVTVIHDPWHSTELSIDDFISEMSLIIMRFLSRYHALALCALKILHLISCYTYFFALLAVHLIKCTNVPVGLHIHMIFHILLSTWLCK